MRACVQGCGRAGDRPRVPAALRAGRARGQAGGQPAGRAARSGLCSGELQVGLGERAGHALPAARGSGGIPVEEASNSQLPRQLATPRARALGRDGERPNHHHHHRSSIIDNPSSSPTVRSSMTDHRPSSTPNHHISYMNFHRHRRIGHRASTSDHHRSSNTNHHHKPIAIRRLIVAIDRSITCHRASIIDNRRSRSIDRRTYVMIIDNRRCITIFGR